MPQASTPSTEHILAKVLIGGDGKCGKSDWAARAAAAGFNVLYLDADVAMQTIKGLPHDAKHPVNPKVLEHIFVVPCHDTLIDGGLDYRFVTTFKRFCTASPVFRWNDTKSREWRFSEDGDETTDEVWEIIPSRLDHTCVLVLDSWTALAQSAMNWAADEMKIDLAEVADDRDKMRNVYQAAGEKLTQYLTMLRSIRCHVIVIAHPREFTKTEKKPNAPVNQKEKDMKVLWTKTVVASSSNNHAFGMAKFFTDLAWLDVDGMGNYMIDFRASTDRMSGSHINEKLNTRTDGRFEDLIRRLGGTVPGQGNWASTDSWLTIHRDGFKAPDGKKPSLVLGAKSESSGGSPAPVQGVKPTGLKLNLTGKK